jgi:hypothetical protein
MAKLAIVQILGDIPLPGYPDNTLPGGGMRPDNSLPGSPGRPDNSLPGGGWNRPVDPGYGRPGSGHPSHPWVPSGGRPPQVWPPSPVDPEWGVEAPPAGPSHPIYIPANPDNSLPLPPVTGSPEHPIANPPPGTIWPPLPEGTPPGKAAVLVWLVGIGYRYAVIEIPPAKPDQGLPGGGSRPDQSLPPTAQPKKV